MPFCLPCCSTIRKSQNYYYFDNFTFSWSANFSPFLSCSRETLKRLGHTSCSSLRCHLRSGSQQRRRSHSRLSQVAAQPYHPYRRWKRSYSMSRVGPRKKVSIASFRSATDIEATRCIYVAVMVVEETKRGRGSTKASG